MFIFSAEFLEESCRRACQRESAITCDPFYEILELFSGVALLQYNQTFCTGTKTKKL